jgi:Sulfotransferase domain
MKQTKLPSSQPLTIAQSARILCRGTVPALGLLMRGSTFAQLPRLLLEGLAPARRLFIQGFNNSELARLVRAQARVTFVCSYARSGNTWMRYLLSDIRLQNEGLETTTDKAQPAKIVPDYYTDLITPRASTESCGYLIKTHDMISQLQKRIGGNSGIRQCRYLYLFRPPEDVLVSLFHISLREKYIRSNAGGNIDLFCLEYLPAWVEHVTNYLDALDNGVTIYLVCYDELLRQPAAILSNALRWLGIPHTTDSVQRAESNMRFGKLQALEARALNGGSRLFRRGVDGSGVSELKPETLAQIRAATRDVMARANESLARQRSNERSGLAAQANASPPTDGSFSGRSETAPASSSR